MYGVAEGRPTGCRCESEQDGEGDGEGESGEEHDSEVILSG